MSDRETEILVQIAKTQGALDSNVQSLKEDLRDFKAKYESNAQTARDHAHFVTGELGQLMYKRDYPLTNRVEHIARSWLAIAILLSIAIGLGFLTFGPAFQKATSAWQQMHGKPGATPETKPKRK